MAAKKFRVTLTGDVVADTPGQAIEEVINFIQDGALDEIKQSAREIPMTAFDKAVEARFSD